jgi:hypothetical protein
LGIGDWAQSPIPNPQSPIPNPHLDSNYSKKIFEKKFNKKNYLYLNKKKLFIINSSNGSK